MKITFDSTPVRYNFPFRIVGFAGRYDTLTDCEFLDEHHIVCADRQMAMLYLVRIDMTENTHELLESVSCVCDGAPQNPDVISISKTGGNHTVYAVSYSNTLFSCEIRGNKFQNLRTRVINPPDAYHGVLSLTPQDVLVTNMRRPTITYINLLTNQKTDIPCAGGCRLKDVAALGDTHLLIVSSEDGPVTRTRTTSCGPLYDSHLLIYERGTNHLVQRHTLPRAQVDCCIYCEPFCFVSYTSMQGEGFILRSRITPEYQFSEVTMIPCAGFPHGLSIHGGLFAYTSYADSALYIHTITEEGEIIDS
jgi:hypothetical protein